MNLFIADKFSAEPAVSVVVGASSGIGRATAHALAERGDHVELWARRLPELEEVAAECRSRGAASASVRRADVADDEAVGAAVAAAVDAHGRLDVVVHCAGIVTYGRTDEASLHDARRVVETNLLGPLTVARHVVPVLREQDHGTLVVVGSLLGHVAVPGMTPYVVSKWGVRALVRQLRIENLDRRGVRVVHVSPGSVDTPIYDQALDDAGMVNSPPPPVIGPDRVARVVLRSLAGRRTFVQTSVVNHAMLGVYTLLPAVWDRLVGPLMDATSRTRREADSHTGAVTSGGRRG